MDRDDDTRGGAPLIDRGRRSEPDDPEELRRAEDELSEEGVEADQPTYPPPPPEGTETTEPVEEDRGDG